MNGIMVEIAMKALYASPLVLVWLYAVAAGGWVSRNSRPAGLCLIAAGLLELIALLTNIVTSALFPVMLDAGYSFELVSGLMFARAVARMLVLVISHTLLLLGIFGWRDR